jgi:hypothetical protein
MLSNLVMADFDARVGRLAEQNGMVYTRYADDLVLSNSDQEFSRPTAMRLISAVYDELRVDGLRPNTAKTHLIPPGARKIVLGLLVDNDVPRLTREWRECMRMHLHFINEFGANAHASRRKFDSTLGLKLHLQGKIAYAKGIDRAYGESLAEEFLRIWKE